MMPYVIAVQLRQELTFPLDPKQHQTMVENRKVESDLLLVGTSVSTLMSMLPVACVSLIHARHPGY